MTEPGKLKISGIASGEDLEVRSVEPSPAQEHHPQSVFERAVEALNPVGGVVWRDHNDELHRSWFGENEAAAIVRAVLMAVREHRDATTRAILRALEREGVTGLSIGAAWAAQEAFIDAILAQQEE